MPLNAWQVEAQSISSPPGESLEHALANVVCEAFWERDASSNGLRWNSALESLFGYPRSEVADTVDWWFERVHPEDRVAVQDRLDRAMSSTAAGFASEYRFRRKDGSWAWVASRSVILRDDEGKARRVLGAMIDVTPLTQALWESREHLRTVLNTLPVGVVVLDKNGNITLTNPATEEIWGRLIRSGEERWNKSAAYWHSTGVRLQAEEWATRRALREGTTSLKELIDIDTFDGQRKIVENSAAPLRDADGEITGAVAVIEDITERVRAEERLRSTQRLLMDAERLGGTGSWEMDLIGGQIFNSEASRRLFFGDDTSKGDRLEDYADVVHPEDRERVMSSRMKMLDGTGPSDIEYRVVWPDGSTHVIFARATVVRDESGRAIRVFGTNADITLRKHAEEELARRATQLESLSRKLIQTQESERRDLSNELHDDLGQMLFALKLTLERKDPTDTESIGLVDGAIARMRDLVHALRPPLLDEYGLEASLRWHVEREATRAGLGFQLELGPLEKRPPAMVEITAFRVAQEAVSNVIRHSQSRGVVVELRETSDELQLVIRDNGHGFDVAVARARAGVGASQGLLSMRERVALVGGELDIESTLGHGTVVTVTLPLSLHS